MGELAAAVGAVRVAESEIDAGVVGHWGFLLEGRRRWPALRKGIIFVPGGW
jgi:hypothetical protein